VLVTKNNTGEAETVALSGDPLLYATFTAELPTAAVPPDTPPIVDEDGGLDVWPGQIVDVTCVDALDGTHTNALKTVTVIITGDDTVPEEPAPDQGAAARSGDGGGGLCSYNLEARFDPIIPTLLLIGLGYLGFRRKSESGAWFAVVSKTASFVTVRLFISRDLSKPAMWLERSSLSFCIRL